MLRRAYSVCCQSARVCGITQATGSPGRLHCGPPRFLHRGPRLPPELAYEAEPIPRHLLAGQVNVEHGDRGQPRGRCHGRVSRLLS